MMYRRVAVVAEREIAELQLCGHRITASPRMPRPKAVRSIRPRSRAVAAPTAAESTERPRPADARAPGDGDDDVRDDVRSCRCYNITYRALPGLLTLSSCEDIPGCSGWAALPRSRRPANLDWGMGFVRWAESYGWPTKKNRWSPSARL